MQQAADFTRHLTGSLNNFAEQSFQHILMKTFIALCSLLVLTLSLSAADPKPDKASPAKSKAAAAEVAKPSAKEEALAKTLTDPQRAQLLSILNTGDEAALMALPGVGDVRAKAIQASRPFADVTNVVSVKGVGDGIFAQMIAYAKAGFKKEAKEAPAKKKAAPKKTDSKETK